MNRLWKHRQPCGQTTTRRWLDISGCHSCGVVFVDPLPTSVELERYYSSAAGWEQSFNPQSMPQMFEQKGRFARKLAEHLHPQLDKSHPSPCRVFDFGCGYGTFLDAFQDLGCQTTGVEPGPGGGPWAEKRHRLLARLPDDETFDLVIVNHVLEHLRDPLQALKDLAACLPMGGLLYVAVPDFGRLRHHGDLNYLISDVHIYSFTFDGLRSLLALAGFEVVVHLDQSEWDRADTNGRPTRLRCVARKGAIRPLPESNPLDSAIDNLRGYRWSMSGLIPRLKWRLTSSIRRARNLGRRLRASSRAA